MKAESSNAAQPGEFPLPDFLYRALGQNIRAERKLKNYSREQLADMLRISKPELAKMEKGEAPINPEQLTDIAKALDIDPEELFDQAVSIHMGDVTSSNVINYSRTGNIGVSEEALNNLTAVLNRMCDLIDQKIGK